MTAAIATDSTAGWAASTATTEQATA